MKRIAVSLAVAAVACTRAPPSANVPTPPAAAAIPAVRGDAGATRAGEPERVESKFELTLGWGYVCVRKEAKAYCGNLSADPSAPRITSTPPVGDFGDVTSVASGQSFTCLSTKRGAIFCAGNNNYGQLGAKLRDETHDHFVQVASISDALRVVAGPWHVCAIRASGRVACWGRNESGQTGSARYYASEARELVVPVEVPGVERVTSVAATFGATCASTAVRALFCWGASRTPEHEKARGSQNETPAELGALSGLTDLTANESVVCGIRGGAAVCFGDTTSSLMKDESYGAKPVLLPVSGAVRVRIAMNHGCILLRGGKVACFGTSALGREVDERSYEAQPPEIVPGLPPAVDVFVGPSVSCALTEKGEVYCWGRFMRPSGEAEQVTSPRRFSALE